MICLISGTNRPNSKTLRITQHYEALYKKLGVETQLLDLTKLPEEIFLPSAFSQKPAGFEVFLNAVLNAQGLHIVAPEYNGSFPGSLKVMIDHLKFPESFERKPVAFTGLASGMWGGLRTVEHLEGIFKYRNAYLFNERVFLPRIETQFSAEGEFTQELTKTLVDSQVKGFVEFVKNLNPKV